MQRFDTDAIQPIGMASDTFLTLQDGTLVGLGAADGRVQPGLLPLEDGEAVVVALDVSGQIIYNADRLGMITAFGYPDAESPLWQTDLDVVGTPQLLSLPGGGVLALIRNEALAVSAAGELLWQADLGARPFAWQQGGNLLALSTSGSDGATWVVMGAAPITLATPISGKPVIVGGQVWVYASDGIYRLDAATQTAELLYALPHAFLERGDVAALPDGGVLVAHTDVFDGRLIALNGDGSLRWQRSFAAAASGEQRLLVQGARVWLVSQMDSGITREVTVFAMNGDGTGLTRLFVGGARAELLHDTWTAVSGEYLLIHIGDGLVVAGSW